MSSNRQALAACAPLLALICMAAFSNLAAAEDTSLTARLLVTQDVYELGTPMRGEISLTNRSADWKQIPDASDLASHLRLVTESKKKIKPKELDKVGAAKATAIGPGGFVGMTFDAAMIFPKLNEPGRYSIEFTPPGAAPQAVSFQVLPPFDTSRDYGMRLETPMGELIIDLFEKDAPVAVHNVVQLARTGFYDGAPIPRIQKDFALRVRGPVEERHKIVPFEATPRPLLSGTVIVEPGNDARSNYPTLHVLLAPQPKQQGSVTVIGQVIKGMDVLEKLSQLPTSGESGKPAWAPVQDVRIQSASVSDSASGR